MDPLRRLLLLNVVLWMLSPQGLAVEQVKPRARALGIPFDGTPGPLNAITDLTGVEVGYATLILDGAGSAQEKATVRTGVTAIFPRGKASTDPVFAGWFSLNGNGEMTGTTWVEESGFLEGPLMITNTHSVGIVRDAVIAWQLGHGGLPNQEWSMPVVAETFDGWLNDVNGFHIKREDAFRALDAARSGPVAEGNVGGGTGMMCYEFKCGTGTSSRSLSKKSGGYSVGVLVQANHGARYQLQIAGVPVGKEITEDAPFTQGVDLANEKGSIIIVVGTDAPLLAHQIKRLARRAALGLARTGAVSGNGSGDIFIAFSTANPGIARSKDVSRVAMLPNDSMNALFVATVQATEEAIINALVAADTMIGVDGHKAVAIPLDHVKQVLMKHDRLNKRPGP